MKKYEFELKRQRLEIWNVAVSRLSKWIPLCVIGFFAYRSVAALAGRTTMDQIQMLLLSDLKVNTAVSHIVMAIFGLGGISYGARERSLRRRSIKQIGEQNKRLEKVADPNRSSSRLTMEGKTRPEDRIL